MMSCDAARRSHVFLLLRAGHGQALLAFLYGLARSRESVFEVTVEDPAPGFEKVKQRYI